MSTRPRDRKETQAGIPEEARAARIRLPQLRPDELREEFQARLDAARGRRDRVHSLLEAALRRP